MPSSRVDDLLAALRAYRVARQEFLRSLGCEASNRDPFAEFSEQLVATVLDGELAASRVQKGYDLTTADGQRVQVRYLANPVDAWVNEHVVDFRGDCDKYAIVVFEGFDPHAIVVFDRARIADVATALGKLYPNQDVTLQLTRRNYRRLLEERDRFAALDVQVMELARPRNA